MGTDLAPGEPAHSGTGGFVVGGGSGSAEAECTLPVSLFDLRFLLL